MVIHTKGMKKSSSATYYCWKSDTQRVRGRKTEETEETEVTDILR